MHKQLRIPAGVEIPNSSMSVVGVDITPKMATFLLQFNYGDNRTINKNRLGALIRAMKARRFKLAPEGIAFARDKEGKIVLINGQHRLRAIEKSGETQTLLVFTNCDFEAYKVIDSGWKRTFAERMRTLGERVAGFNVSAVRRAIFGGDANYEMQDEEVLALTEIHKDKLDKIYSVLRETVKGDKIKRNTTCAGVAGALLRLTYHEQDINRVLEIAYFMRHGLAKCATSNVQPLAVLRDYLMTMKGTAGGDTSRRIFEEACYAFDAFLKNESIVKLQPHETCFPFPDEIVAIHDEVFGW